jgi:hypothetical protein
MKESFFLIIGLWLLVVGCLKPLPPEPPQPVMVDVKALPDAESDIQILVEPEAGPVIKTWLSKDEVKNQQEEQDDSCQKGDPLCEVIP